MYKRRYSGRRTARQIERDVMDAIAHIIEEKGVSSVTIKEVSKVSKTDVIVLERRYKTDEGLVRAYTSQFDFFLNDHIGLDAEQYATSEAFFTDLITRFIDAIYKNKDMQSIMVWEMYEDSALTRKSARRREDTLTEFLPGFTKLIDEKRIMPEALFAVLTGGLYYILLRGKRSTFCGIDFSTKAGRQLLADTLLEITRKFLIDHPASE
ncbi:TetR/AcrR family transcriptional regulator [Porphyromonas sp. oral taxon 278]|uniref:TetR/AcrR family transcriptional regulator n=1 Tax=Porphyromonas sp. oral taxon 278 TaxID=712437 RepID=UPI0003FD1060|nr:hypothetical protein [Porphyromonas sp. oral taxon 278]